jgi:hypothetical protein
MNVPVETDTHEATNWNVCETYAPRPETTIQGEKVEECHLHVSSDVEMRDTPEQDRKSFPTRTDTAEEVVPNPEPVIVTTVPPWGLMCQGDTATRTGEISVPSDGAALTPVRVHLSTPPFDAVPFTSTFVCVGVCVGGGGGAS